MMLRNVPDPKYNAVASSRPIPIDNTNAVETEGNCILSAVKQLQVLLFDPPYSNIYSLILKQLFRKKTGPHLPELKPWVECLEMSSATNEVATLRRGILNTLDIMLNIDIETPAEANSRDPINRKHKNKLK